MPPVISIHVFLDTGLQRHFVPLLNPQGSSAPAPQLNPPQDLLNAFQQLETWAQNGSIPQETLDALQNMANAGHSPISSLPDCPWLRYRFGEKTWTLSNGSMYTLFGIWFFIETNTADGSSRGGVSDTFDRGLFYQRNALSAQEHAQVLARYSQNLTLACGSSPYVTEQAGSRRSIDLTPALPKGLTFGSLDFQLVFVQPAGEIRDVDLILDLGNTRTAALLFEHLPNQTIPPVNFRMQFKPLRLKPNPASGEFSDVDDVTAGVADSWFVLHELDHQRYRGPADGHDPDPILTQWNVKVDRIKTGRFFSRYQLVAVGDVIERIPQMFMQISPVLVGDAAYQQFYGAYAHEMVKVGAAVQQSSPKRFYWDDQPASVNWSMLLNEWDPHYDPTPQDAPALPTMQGEICRFIDDKSGRVQNNLNADLAPTERPDPYPQQPRYPRQSTIVWFLLHILERAYAQANQTFMGMNFIPHRLRNILVTYPSGWTEAEIQRYRERCQEALDIFSTVNVRGGINSPLRLQLVPQDRSPDEAVAGQLPFIFSETIRYPGQTIGDWISTMGRKRGTTSTVRVMNFDIGGGTTDISIIEYRDESDPNVGLNDLHTKLLFKDGQSIAGDDLLKKVIEAIVFRGLTENSPLLAQRVTAVFSQAAADQEQRAIRCRIVRNCLIPLATYCLAHSGNENEQFSAQTARIEPKNWNEFDEFIGKDAQGRPLLFAITQPAFHFDAKEIAALIEDTFQPLFARCALYAAAYEVDLVVFSGKTSELPHVRAMAVNSLPLEEERLLFARSFRPGQWYPFTNPDGFVSDAKTVTVVGAALHYALSTQAISNWTIHSDPPALEDVRNEWGVLAAMTHHRNAVILGKDADTATVRLLPNTILARRRNAISAPEPVFKVCPLKPDQNKGTSIEFTLQRISAPDSLDESIQILSATAQDGTDVTSDFILKLHPYPDGVDFWQETGFFNFLN